MTACGTDKAKLSQAYVDKAKVDAAQEATAAAAKLIEEARRMPPYPGQCEKHGHTGVVLNDWYDVANQKADNTVGDLNKQIDWCAAWYHRIWKSREPK
ncbi:hypothetical protein [Mesorhizobium sp. B2-4-6]|uniref:hypothetical protein n=1 Tax=Mesorhizobium sp. B2-4-6 TaxID=2589943 RepID=UPI001125C34D|nr:hypothetical protein [Mesorhizobium sp. B2-4-6]TPL40714.1 hypothetical protein FJ957_26140 [Mesorhizobium sp. B2-4-6]